MVEKLKVLSDKLQWLHVFLLVGAASAFFYFMFDRSELDAKRQSVVVAQNEINTLDRKVQEAREFEKQVDVKRKRLTTMTKDLVAMQSSLPRQFFLPDLINEILKETKQLEVEVLSITPDQKEEARDLYNSLGFNLEIKATFIQLFILMDRIAHVKKVMNLFSFTLSLDSGRKTVVLGGDEGAFAGSKLTGGALVHTGMVSTLRVISFRYKGMEK